MLLEDITGKIINAFYEVYNTLGYGFLEKVYENAMMIELKKMSLNPVSQQKIKVYYEGCEVGDYFADIVVDGEVVVELKALECLVDEHKYQLVNYLKATKIEVGLLFNFGKKPEFKRVIFTNDRKGMER